MLFVSFSPKHLLLFPLIGIDFSESLLAVAARNFDKFSSSHTSSLVLSDVVAFKSFTESNRIFHFAYNPFGSETLAKILRNISPGDSVFFAYLEPVFDSLLADNGFKLISSRKSRFYETRSRSFSLWYRPPLP